MAHKSQTDGIKKNSSLPSVFFSKSDLNEGSLQWATDARNGQVLMVLSMDNNCSATSFDMELCAEKLKSLGVQVAVDQWRSLLQNAVLKPEVRRYMFYNSRAFRMAIAMIFYMSLWTNIYSTVQLCSFGRYWAASVLVTVAAVAVTAVVILIIGRRQRKINVNTDVRLAAVNEIFIKHNLILGITDVLDGLHNVLQLWFVHFSPERCLQALSARLAELRRMQESDLRHSLDQLCVVMETAVQPDPGKVEQVSSEETPLLSTEVNLTKEPVTCNELLCLIPEGPPEVTRKGARASGRAGPQGSLAQPASSVQAVSAEPVPRLLSLLDTPSFHVAPHGDNVQKLLTMSRFGEVMAQQLLVIFSGCYVRLLVSGQLPHTTVTGHVEHGKVPCLCQFIETSVLVTGHRWFTAR